MGVEEVKRWAYTIQRDVVAWYGGCILGVGVLGDVVERPRRVTDSPANQLTATHSTQSVSLRM